MPTAPQKFLVIRLSSIGDIVHALPAVSALSETFPQAEITWAIESRYAVLLEDNPCVHQVAQIDTLNWRQRLLSARTLREVVTTIHMLREDRFDAVIDFQGLLKTGLLAWLCRSHRRIGYARWKHREPGAGFFYTEEVSLHETVHVIEESLALVNRLGARTSKWSFPLPQKGEDENYIEAKLAKIESREFILVSPGGGWIAKRWSPQNYAALVKRLGAETNLSLVLTGSPADEADIVRILSRASCERAHYIPTTLGQYLALARRARLFIGGDTGPMHLAAALGVPIVALMGPTDATRNGPFSPEDIALSNLGPVNHTRRPKVQKFLEGISVDEVFVAIGKRLARAHEQ